MKKKCNFSLTCLHWPANANAFNYESITSTKCDCTFIVIFLNSISDFNMTVIHQYHMYLNLEFYNKILSVP